MDIEGFTRYTIYNDGRIYSKRSNKFLKHVNINRGYKVVNIMDDNDEIKFKQVHILVAQHYLPNPNNYSEVDHIDKDPSNCYYTNLRWCTHLENCQNRSMFKNNKLGHSNITIRNVKNKNISYQYQKNYYGIKKCRVFKTLIEALCYKFIQELEMKANLFNNSLMILNKKTLSYKVQPIVIRPKKNKPKTKTKVESIQLPLQTKTCLTIRCHICGYYFVSDYFFNKHKHHKK